MRRARLSFASMVLLALILGGALARPASANVVAAELGWTLVASMATERQGHSATALGDGRILIAGGYGGRALAAAEIYDPRADRWSPTGRMVAPRWGHLALRLSNGRVMVVAGLDNGATDVPFAEVYDPATSTWVAFGPPGDLPRDSFRHLVALADGRVLVMTTTVEYENPNRYVNRASIFDPSSGELRAVASPPTSRGYPTMTLLRDGRVLVAGGERVERLYDAGMPSAVAEIYDPATDAWTIAAPLGLPRHFHAAALLANGQVLVVGGYAPPGSEDLYTRAAEVYDPTTKRWSPTGSMAVPGAVPLLTALPDGRMLATGGNTQALPQYENANERRYAEVYDPATGRWTALPPMLARRSGHAAIVLPDGQVLVIGGYGGGFNTGTAQSAERYGPGSSTGTCFFQTGRCMTGRFLAYWEASGGLALNGYPLTNERDERLEDGKVYRVQYFERVRLELHPENAPPYDLLLGQFGRRIVAGVAGAPTASVGPQPGTTHFPQTGHNVGPRFLAYWEANGGLARFGFPLSEEFEERLEDGRTYRVQYFERARFEYHPEYAGSPNEVLLGQFGRRILAKIDAGR